MCQLGATIHSTLESLLGTSPVASPLGGVGMGDGEFSENGSTGGGILRSSSGKFASSLSGGGFDLTEVKAMKNSGGNNFIVELNAKKPAAVSGNGLSPGDRVWFNRENLLVDYNCDAARMVDCG